MNSLRGSTLLPVSRKQVDMAINRYVDMIDRCKTYEEVKNCRQFGRIVFKQMRQHKMFSKALLLSGYISERSGVLIDGEHK